MAENTLEVTREILRKVRRVEIKTKRMVTDAMSGAYHSAFKGQGMDFEEVREYAPGDDVRSIDWNVTAKMDTPYIKKYREERELTIMLAVDLSGSGVYGSVEESKRELAAELASVLAFSATKNNDKVGLILFTDEVEKVIFPKKGRQHVLRLIREILFFQPEKKGTDIAQALDFLNRVTRHSAIVFLISDFLQGPDGRLTKFVWNSALERPNPMIRSMEVTNKRHDLICVTLTDPREMVLPKAGVLILEDSETGEVVEVDTMSRRVRDYYERLNRERRGELEKFLKTRQIDAIHLSTEGSYMRPLREFLHRRMNRL